MACAFGLAGLDTKVIQVPTIEKTRRLSVYILLLIATLCGPRRSGSSITHPCSLFPSGNRVRGRVLADQRVSSDTLSHGLQYWGDYIGVGQLVPAPALAS